MNPTKIDISRIKQFAYNEIPRDYVLRDILLGERDEMDIVEFAIKIGIWLKLMRGKRA